MELVIIQNSHKLNALLFEILIISLHSQQAPWLDSHQAPWLDSQQAPWLDSLRAPWLDLHNRLLGWIHIMLLHFSGTFFI